MAYHETKTEQHELKKECRASTMMSIHISINVPIAEHELASSRSVWEGLGGLRTGLGGFQRCGLEAPQTRPDRSGAPPQK